VSNPRQVITQWMSFTDVELTDHVRHLVRNQGPQTSQVWAQVRTNAVLAGRVRGTLSILRAQTRDSRDAAMWTAWISKAQQELAAQPAPAPEPEPVTAAVEPEPVFERPVAEAPAKAAESNNPLEFSLPDAPARQPKPTSSAPAVMFQAPGQ
jgi:membrane peptidoglycan carboxypeptidase